jgi:hypothetical protein
MTIFNSLNLSLDKINSPSSLGSLLSSTFDIQAKLDAAITSKLGTQVNQVIGGFQAITQELDAPGDFVSNQGVAMLVSDPPGLQLTKNPSSLNSDLEAITETSMGGGFLNVTITANTPEAITKALSSVANVPTTALTAVMQEISPAIDKVQSQINGVLSEIQKGFDVFNGALSEISAFEQKINQQFSAGLSGLLGNVTVDFQLSLPPLFSSFVDINAATSIDPSVADVTTINSTVQVQSILASATREITTAVVSCSNTFKDQDVRASNVPGWHFLITRAGELQQVQNINQTGAFNDNYSNYTVGVIFAGGLNTTVKEAADQDKRNFASVDSITREQFNAFDQFMTMFYSIFPHGQAVGLQDIARSESPFPGFDVRSYCKQRFGKDTIIDTTKPAPSLSELEIQMNLSLQGASNPGIEDEPTETDTGAQ